MNTLNITLPEEMGDFIRDEVAHGGYDSASEYIGEIIRQERARKAGVRLESLLLEGLDSGPMTEMTGVEWESLRDQLRQRWADRKQPA